MSIIPKLSRRHNLMFLIGVVAVVVPTCLIALLAVVYYYLGIEKLFSQEISKSINTTVEIARSYLNEHVNSIKIDTLSIVNDLDDNFSQLTRNSNKLTRILDSHALSHNLSEIIIFNKQKIIGKTSKSFSLLFDTIPYDILAKADQGEICIRRVSDDKVQAIIRLDLYINYIVPGGMYLLIGRYLDEQIVRHLQETETSASSYSYLHDNIDILRTRVFTAMGAMSLFFLFGALFLVANLIVKPVNRIVQATTKISEGNFDIRVPESKAKNEIATLSKAFNRMVQRIQEQHLEVQKANEHLTERKRFIEIILSRLSAGVLVLDAKLFIVLSNDSASKILHRYDLIGQKCFDVFPEIEELLIKGDNQDIKSFNDQNYIFTAFNNNIFKDDNYVEINIQRRDKNINLLTKISLLKDRYEETIIITFDDITELVKAQRFEAWADIARRIAHEIKNPLTPIQLAIELLEKKFLKQIHEDVDTFAKYIRIIIGRVEDIRKMVTNFANFANISTPIIETHDIVNMINEVIVLQKIANRNIDYQFDNSLQACYVHCDRMQIIQVLTNLLKNSSESVIEKLKNHNSANNNAFSEILPVSENPISQDYKGFIKICVNNSNNRVKISVYDNGLGLDMKIADKISEPYTTTKKDGSGLGLSIVNRIVKEHKGKFEILNLNNGGVKASFDLQLANNIHINNENL